MSLDNLFGDENALGPSRRKTVIKQLPMTPETGWRPPTHFPNLSAAKLLSFDVETKEPDFDHGPGWARDKGHIVGIGIGADDGYGNKGKWYFPMRHEVEPEFNLDPTHVTNFARDALERTPALPKTGANLTYDIGWLGEENIHVQGELHDVQFAEALLNHDGEVNLDHLGFKYLGRGKEGDLMYKWQAEAYGGAANGSQRANIWRTSPRLVGFYGEGDVALPIDILRIQGPMLEREGLLTVYRMECDLIYLMIEMRRAGVTVDIPAAERLYAQLGSDLLRLQGMFKHELGFDLNPNAAASIAKAFEHYGLKYPRTDASASHPNGQPSFTKDFLKVHDHPIAQQILEYRMFDKTRSAFVRAAILERHHNGRVHPTFNQLRGEEEGAGGGKKRGTGVGRFSGQDPNLQQVPVRAGPTEEKLTNKKLPTYDPDYVLLGERVRSLFIPDYGHVCWQKDDFSQIQYRGLVDCAVGAGADDARAAYNLDPATDYHSMVQNMIERVAGMFIERKPLKTINFGLAFGMGVKKLMRMLGVDKTTATKIMTAYFAGAPYVKETMDYFSDIAMREGVIVSALGRKVRFNMWEPIRQRGDAFEDRKIALPYDRAIIQYGTRIQRAYGHKALVTRLQMMEGDTIKSAMVRCHKEGVFAVTGVPRITVHDELGHSVRDTSPRTTEAYAYMKHAMETATPLRIPVMVDSGRGPNWGAIA